MPDVNPDDKLEFSIDGDAFFSVGRALVRGFGSYLMGSVKLHFSPRELRVESSCGEGVAKCEGTVTVVAEVPGTAFVDIIRKHKSGTKYPRLRCIIRLDMMEIGIGNAPAKRAVIHIV